MIEWVKLDEKQPPIGQYVLTYHANSDCPCIQTDQLNFGNKRRNQYADEGLLYWDSGCDYDEITHWAELPNLPHNVLINVAL